MPRVETYGERKIGTAALPGVRVRSAETYESAGGLQGEALSSVGRAATGLGAELLRQERDNADQIAHTAALRQLSDWKLKRLFDPQQGALTLKGKDSFALPEQIAAEYDQVTAGIKAGLTTKRQQQAFARADAAERESVLLTVQRHVAGERQRYDEAEHTAYVNNQAALAEAQASDPRQVTQAIHNVVAATRDYGTRNGAGKEAVDLQVASVQNGMWTRVITRALADKQDKVAKAYFEEAKEAGQLSGEALARLAEKVKHGSSLAEGERAADEIWAAHGPQDDADPIQIDRMTADARERFKDDVDTMNAAIAALRSRKHDVDDGRQQRDGNRKQTIWGAVLEGRSYDEISRLPEAVDAPDDLLRVRDYLQRQAEHREQLAFTREQRALAAEARKDRELEMKGWSTYWETSQPEVLRALTPGQIMAKLPELGTAHVNRLLNAKQQLTENEAKFREGTIDDDLFKEVASEAGLGYVYKPTTPDQKANVGKLKTFVEDEIARAQQKGQRLLTRDEKRAVMQSLVDRKVTIDKQFWYDPEVPAAIVNAKDRTSAYVPIDQVPDVPGPPDPHTGKPGLSVLDRYVNYLNSEIPGLAARRLPKSEIVARYAPRIQRAWALRLLGGTQQEIEKALRGDE